MGEQAVSQFTLTPFERVALQRLPKQIEEQREKLKNEMLGMYARGDWTLRAGV